ncbi:unnamed protein product [Trichobilharzia regenti]|uniref:Uncharacterized protein n=1 Tax=Trichobilharzia regenti TaxID=157069 RepID=A0A183VPY5_TRIRE|nr:unnamed protein product [Trichobilharzia regenti]VDP98420.1 unnamed protein product [Trichobilharzia regenti]
MSFFTQFSSSSDEDEGLWPPPGRRKRHPAGDKQPDEYSSTSSSDCVSNIFMQTSDPMTIAQNRTTSHRFQFNESLNSSSGIFSQPANHSFQSNEPPFSPLFSDSFDGVQNCPGNNVDMKICSRFNTFQLDDNNPSTENEFNPSSTPLMLRRFLSSQPTSRTELSQSLPPVRFQTWVNDSSLS